MSIVSKKLQAPSVTGGTDPNFNQVALLLHGDGTNGAQNNTFVDSSTNNFTITRNGNTAQGTFSPFSLADGQWSNYFDGTGDYLTAPSNAAFQMGTGAYTIEGWVYLTQYDTESSVVFESGNASGGLGLFVSGTSNSLGKGYLYLNKYGTGVVVKTDVASVPLNTWTHVAAVRSSTASNDTRLYVNGVLKQTGTDSNNWTVSTTPSIGGLIALNSYDVYGYISNLRIVKGTAVYTSNFTPPTSALTAVSGTSLLTCQSNRFKDNSSNNFTITSNGDTRVTAFSPFAPSAAYSASTNGGSGYFDGSGDYLTLANNANLDMGSSSFTIEGWFYTNSVAAGFKPIITRFNGNAISQSHIQYLISQNGSTLQLNAYGASVVQISFTSALSVGQWYHFALVRDGNNIYGYLNGVRNATTGTISGALNNSTWLTYIGYYNEGGSIGYLNGYASNIRIVKGTALYTGSTYTIPTAPLTAITNTSLLLNCTNAGIIDNAGKNDIETVGNAQISTSVKKYGTGSMYFDGTGDYLKGSPNIPSNFGSGDFTVEGWIYANSFSTTPIVISNEGYTWAILIDTGGVLRYYLSSNGTSWNLASNISMGSALSTGTWYHFALVRNGSTFTPYINGTSGTTTTSSSALFNGTGIFNVGGQSAGNSLNGYIDELRITKGLARYTANFTPTTQAFPDQ